MAGTKTQVQTGTGSQSYLTSMGKPQVPSFINMYGAASGNNTSDLLDKIISGQLASKESYLPKLKALALQKEAERQETVRQEMQKNLLAEAAQVQAEQQAIGGAIKAGSMVMGKMGTSGVGPTENAIQGAPTTSPITAPSPAGEVTPQTTATPNIGTPSSVAPEVISPTLASTQDTAVPSANTAGAEIAGASPEGQIQAGKDLAITKQVAESQGDVLRNLKGTEIKADAASKQIEAKVAEINDADSAHEAKQKMEELGPLIENLNVIKGVGTARVRDLKALGKGALGAILGGFNLATTLAGGLENQDALGLANTGVGAVDTAGNLAKFGGEVLNNQALANIGNTLGQGAGAVAPVLGIASGLQGILDDPSNPTGYTNTAMATINAIPVAANLLAPAAVPVATGAAAAPVVAGETAAAVTPAASGALSGAASAASAVALPLALIAAGEAGRGAFGGPGKIWDDKNRSEKLWDNPGMTTLNPGYIIGSVADEGFFNPGGIMGDFAKFSGAAERISMAPIDWLFSGNMASTKDAWYDIADIFGW